MAFMERVENMICLLYFDFLYESFPAKDWDPFFSEILGRPTTMVDTIKKAEMWLIQSYWDLDFSCPSLPNIEFVGGLHCKPAKPLPKLILPELFLMGTKFWNPEVPLQEKKAETH
ncbi:UDP-glucuronosyltransferase 2B7-like [Arvicanthis niloticus]|uniref:UDP-glucuronosyltransferase 2B7-like n=1 Tax=Arvicanthis niloticus TaxID=61156 RepID=UPI00403C07BB